MSVDFAADILSGIIFFGVLYAVYRFNPKLNAKVNELIERFKK